MLKSEQKFTFDIFFVKVLTELPPKRRSRVFISVPQKYLSTIQKAKGMVREIRKRRYFLNFLKNIFQIQKSKGKLHESDISVDDFLDERFFPFVYLTFYSF